MDDTYRAAVVDTFRRKALRTAHIIDDEFPTYLQLAEATDARAKYPELGLATDLYKLFRKNHIPCDVDNSILNLKEEAGRIRKSDLIILDYNLAHNDTRMSVSLARELSRTEHFNTIILYTAAENLDDVWLNLAIGLRCGWSEKSPGGSTEAFEELARMDDGNVEIPAPPRELIAAHVLGRNLALADVDDASGYQALFSQNGVPKELHADMLAALVRREVRRILADDQESRDAPPRTVDGGCETGRPRWLQSGNCFLAVMGKRTENGKEVTADRLFDALDEALCEWRPNLLQIIVSEIQNLLELEAIATDEVQLRDPATQVSLCYYLLSALEDGAAGRTPEALAPPLHTLLDKLVDGVRQKLVTNADLKALANRVLLSEIGRMKVATTFANPKTRARDLFKHAKDMAGGSSAETESSGALMRLNAFLSTEPFRGELTTGTVFSDGKEYWVCTTPACDLIASRAPNPGDPNPKWTASLHPMKPIVASRLKPQTDIAALKDAEDIRFVFLRIGEDLKAFEFAPSKGGPSYEFFFLDEGGRMVQDASQHRFKATRIAAAGEHRELREFSPASLHVVGQIRPNYASRYLQQTGHWLSRIGVDFLRWE